MSDKARHNYALWLGPLLGLLGVAGYFAVIIQVGWRSHAEMPWPNLLLVVAAIAVSLLGAIRAWQVRPTSLIQRTLAMLGVGFSSFAAFALAGYLLVGSAQLPSADNATPVGEPFPVLATALLDSTGSAFDLAGAARGDLILIFFRGHW